SPRSRALCSLGRGSAGRTPPARPLLWSASTAGTRTRPPCSPLTCHWARGRLLSGVEEVRLCLQDERLIPFALEGESFRRLHRLLLRLEPPETPSLEWGVAPLRLRDSYRQIPALLRCHLVVRHLRHLRMYPPPVEGLP